MNTVYVVAETSYNLLPAEKFGKIQVMLTREDIAKGMEHCIEQLSEHLCKLTPDDFVVLTGNTLLVGLATHIALHYTEGEVNFLVWKKEEYCYHNQHISI